MEIYNREISIKENLRLPQSDNITGIISKRARFTTLKNSE